MKNLIDDLHLSCLDQVPEVIDVRIHQGILSQSSPRHLQYGMLIDWFSCPTHNWKNEWDIHWIADIHFMEKVILENLNYSAFLNGTLLIKKVLPMYDGRYFIRRVSTASGAKPNIYHLKVVQVNVYLLLNLFYMLSLCIILSIFWRLYQYFSFSLLITEHPVLTLVSQQNIYAFEGMDVFFEAQVKADP